MAPRAPLLLLLLALLLLAGATRGQHWSHGWYPGGKRDLGAPPGLQPRPSRTTFPITPRSAPPSPSSLLIGRRFPPSTSHPSPPSGRHVAGAEALPAGGGRGGRVRPRGRLRSRFRPRPRPRLEPAAGAGPGPQDPARPPRQGQGGPRQAAAARRPRRARRGHRALPAAPRRARGAPLHVQGRGAAAAARGAPAAGGLGGAAGGAPAAHGLERGRERPAAGPQRGKDAEGSGGAAEAEAAGCGEQGQAAGGLPARQGERRAPPAGGSQIVPHPREPGGAHRGVPGQPPQLQLRHRQGGPRGQAHPAALTGCQDGTLSLSPLPLPQIRSRIVGQKGSGEKGKGKRSAVWWNRVVSRCPLSSCSGFLRSVGFDFASCRGVVPRTRCPAAPWYLPALVWHKRRVPAASRGVSAPPVNLVCVILSKTQIRCVLLREIIPCSFPALLGGLSGSL